VKERNRLLVALLVVCLVLGLGSELREILEAFGLGIPPIPVPYGRSALYNLIAVALAIGAAIALKGGARAGLAADLGLRWNGSAGPLLTLLATLPCWLGLAVSGKLATDFTALDLLFGSLLFPLAEELVFRGFGFIFTHRTLRWPITLAVLLQAVVFGLIHWIGAGASGPLALQVFLITALGGIFFAVLDALYGYTLWSGWVWHGSVNAAWTVFSVADTAAGGWLANVLRFGSLALALLVAILVRRLSRRSHLPRQPSVAER
jgi:uncharacterized protein